jgi:hypothetical protein
MPATWVKIAGTLILLVLAFGCRTPKPDLKPPMTAEALNTPPSEKRFDSSDYPKEAFNNRDAIRKLDMDQAIMPAKASMPGQPLR